jgi:hypothetical protein
VTLRIIERAGGVAFAVRVQPRASRSSVNGIHGDALKVRVTAPPAEGAANAALIELLAAELGVAKRAVRIVRGSSARTKLVEVDALNAAEVRARLRV